MYHCATGCFLLSHNVLETELFCYIIELLCYIDSTTDVFNIIFI